jgi:hypothetical protein
MSSELINNSLSSAFNFGNQSGNTTWNWKNTLSTTDPNHYYRFSLSSSSRFNLALAGLRANANLALLNSSGSVIATSANLGVTAESIDRQLTVGLYYIRVAAIGGAATSYSLGLRGAGTGVDPGNTIAAAFDYGSFTTNTSRNFSDSVSTSDTQDLFRINALQNSTFRLSLNNLRANAEGAALLR